MFFRPGRIREKLEIVALKVFDFRLGLFVFQILRLLPHPINQRRSRFQIRLFEQAEEQYHFRLKDVALSLQIFAKLKGAFQQARRFFMKAAEDTNNRKGPKIIREKAFVSGFFIQFTAAEKDFLRVI